jgi:putative membrane protein
MAQIALRILVSALSVLLAAKIVPGLRVRSFGSAVLFAIALAVLHKLLWGLLVFLSFPFVLVTFGLFLLVINAFLFWLADKVVGGVEARSFGAAFLGSVVTSLFTWLAYRLIA